MKSILLYSLLGVIIITIVSCQKIVHVNLETAKPQLVIDADMSNIYGLRVYLTKSVGFYENNVFPTVDNALVSLKNLKTNKVDIIPFQGKGEYFLFKKPTVGTTYLLTVNVDSVQYTAQSTMPPIKIPDSITFTRRNAFGKDIISAKVNFQDKAGEADFYLFKQNIVKSNKWTFFPFSDRLSDGRYIQYSLRNDSAYLSVGDTVIINMQCIDKNVYNYFSVIENITADDNGFGSTSPANPPTNIVGNALGIFNVHSDHISKVRVPNNVPKE